MCIVLIVSISIFLTIYSTSRIVNIQVSEGRLGSVRKSTVIL